MGLVEIDGISLKEMPSGFQPRGVEGDVFFVKKINPENRPLVRCVTRTGGTSFENTIAARGTVCNPRWRPRNGDWANYRVFVEEEPWD